MEGLGKEEVGCKYELELGDCAGVRVSLPHARSGMPMSLHNSCVELCAAAAGSNCET
jgi:hypothetical protein